MKILIALIPAIFMFAGLQVHRRHWRMSGMMSGLAPAIIRVMRSAVPPGRSPVPAFRCCW